jgi:hypothetical protein
MKVLVGCEESGKVRDAFLRRGHDAWSNDLIPARNGGGPHLQMDVMQALYEDDWDLAILHPDCTSMAVSGNRYYGKGKPDHWQRLGQVQWTVELWEKAKRRAKKGVVLENPASVIFPALRARGAVIQYIHPWQHGHMEQKKTGLALDRLPPLEETNNVYEEMMKLPSKERERIWSMPPGPNRKRDRSETFDGIAEALAEQYGSL